MNIYCETGQEGTLSALPDAMIGTTNTQITLFRPDPERVPHFRNQNRNLRQQSMTTFILMAITGLMVGWLAGENLTGRGLGMKGGILAGMLGAIAGGYLLGMIPAVHEFGLPGELAMSTLGATAMLSLSCCFKTAPVPLVARD